jgi:hypothetical protein
MSNNNNNEQAARTWATFLADTSIHCWVGQRTQDDWDDWSVEDVEGTCVELTGPATQMNFIHELAHNLGLLSMTLEWDAEAWNYSGDVERISATLFLTCSETDLSIHL